MFIRSRVRRLALAAAAVAAVTATGACTPITSYAGFQAVDAQPADVKVGEDTKSTVLTKLGSPSATSTFDPNLWYYVTQVSERIAFYNPRVASREVVAVTFRKEDEQVVAVNKYGLTDGRVIDFSNRETPTRGREMTVLEQLLGNVARGGMLPQDEVGPGQQPGR
jgi:outer membrane protein assembly factor BamE (lipoprotein component of BamABCDE complex)